MKRLSLFFFFILLFNLSPYASETVKGIKLVSIEDGKQEEYTGYKKI